MNFRIHREFYGVSSFELVLRFLIAQSRSEFRFVVSLKENDIFSGVIQERNTNSFYRVILRTDERPESGRLVPTGKRSDLRDI